MALIGQIIDKRTGGVYVDAYVRVSRFGGRKIEQTSSSQLGVSVPVGVFTEIEVYASKEARLNGLTPIFVDSYTFETTESVSLELLYGFISQIPDYANTTSC